MSPINEIIIHCAATKPSMDIGADWIRRIHIHENKWRDIGYHYVIRRNGAVEDGRPISQTGTHCFWARTNIANYADIPAAWK